MTPNVRPLYLFAFLLIPIFSFSQTPAKWSVNGNATVNGDFLGTTNNEPLIFYTNNVETMRLKANGELRIDNLGVGNGFVTANNNGTLGKTLFTNDSNQILTGAGTFRNISTLSPWQQNGNFVFLPSGKVGIGTNNPQYKLDVQGNASFSGTVFASAIHLVNKMEADTIKGVSMVEVNNTLELSGGIFSEVYTNTGDLRLQSRSGFNGNLLLATGTTGNVGVGIFTPQYKFDVNGDVRLNGKTHIYRIVPLQGDSIIRFGDSTIYVYPSQNLISSTQVGQFRGLGIGFGINRPYGQGAITIGTKVEVSSTATNAIVIGRGAITGSNLINTIPNSLVVGFNSTLSTLFVGPGNGNGTIGKVGIGTTNPKSDLQVGDGYTSISAGPAQYVATTFSTSYIGFNVARTGANQWMTQNDNGNNGGTVLLGDIAGGFRIVGLPSTGATNQTPNDQFIQDHTKFYVRNDGRIEIGTSKIIPGSLYDDALTRMTVDGRIMCKDLVVSNITDWPDYVFDSTYVLMPLDTVANYINTNKHLPGSNSSVSVEQNGISISATTKAQQQQIEEMMLYILQLNERMKALEAENAKLKANGGK